MITWHIKLEWRPKKYKLNPNFLDRVYFTIWATQSWYILNSSLCSFQFGNKILKIEFKDPSTLFEITLKIESPRVSMSKWLHWLKYIEILGSFSEWKCSLSNSLCWDIQMVLILRLLFACALSVVLYCKIFLPMA